MARKQKKKSQLNNDLFYDVITTSIGNIGIVWYIHKKNHPKFKRIFLPAQRSSQAKRIKNIFPSAKRAASKKIFNEIYCLKKLCDGETAYLPRKYFDVNNFTIFEKRILDILCKIPHGKVLTYSELAHKAATSSGARAVGNVLAKNPFPIIFPCHRIICSDGSIGGFQEGTELKRKLLKREGVLFDNKEKLILKTVHKG